VRDFKWMSNGGLLLDGSGDLACTDPSTLDSVRDIMRSRLKAKLDGWKLYRIGADLSALLGSTVSEELELTIRRQVSAALSADFLPARSFTVETLAVGENIHVMVYVNDELMATTIVSKSGVTT
jgi:hypothetical protein